LSDLPLAWAEATVGELATLTDGPFGSNLKTAHYVTDGPRVVRLQNIGPGLFRDEEAHVTPEHFKSLRKHEVFARDVVAASLGEDAPRACLVPVWLGQAIVKADCIRIRVEPGVEPAYLMWMLNSPPVRAEAARSIKGVGRPRLGLGGIKRLTVPLPPLNEQRRIVAAIEQHFSRLDAADASLDGALASRQMLEPSVVDAAVTGGWPTKPLGELLKEPLRNGHSAKAVPGGGVRTLTLTAVTKRDFSEANTKLTGADPDRVEGLWLEPGDVLIERSNTPELVGSAACYQGPERWAIFPDLLIRVRVGDAVLPEFLDVVLRTRRVRRYFQGVAQGIAGSMPKIGQGAIERVEVPVPPLAEQRRIVARVEEQLSAIDALRAAIERAQKRSASLRRSVLERAFRGELVPQDLSDEPASVLLERIRAEREASPVSNGRGRKRR
jgi:type I restriction enzyme S subunit